MREVLSEQPTGLMQDWPLTVDKMLDHAARWHGGSEIVSRFPSGSILRSDYSRLHDAAKRISTALISLGVQRGDRIATLGSNSFDHLSLWYGIMGIGAVCHTLNPRLPKAQLGYIANHAGDVMLFADSVLSLLAGRIATLCPRLRRVVTINDARPGSDSDTLTALIGDVQANCRWGGFDERTPAGLCYTSGTTGDPKGVLYSHRSNYLHALHTMAPDAFALSARDVIMPVVPMFHANTWGLAFSGPAVGAKLVLPGPMLDGKSLHALIEAEAVTFAAGVPTVWQGYVDHLRDAGVRNTPLERVVIGGSACPESLMNALEELGAKVIHAWGMTELSPVGLVASPTPAIAAMSPAEQRQMALKQGRPIGIDARITDDEGNALPHDGEAVGRLQVRGASVVQRYFGHDNTVLTHDGWFDTGDIATIDPHGYVRITDRAKDIIKSGGEWISSVDIENAAMTHPNVAVAAVVAIPHSKWGERPKLYVQLRRPSDEAPDSYRRHLEPRVARWWLPDEVEIVEAIPIGSTGKVDKKALRARTGDPHPIG